MTSWALLLILVFYLGVLFFLAHWSEKKANHKWTNNAYVYSLSLAVYCTAWTYYGSVGVAANSGLYYLSIYIGPLMIIPAWMLILKKIIRISRVNKISSIADFISLRYGNHRFLGALVTIVCVLGILPYIALQLKAISETFHLVSATNPSKIILNDTTTYVAIALALFASYYGTRYVDASEKRKGIITAVAVESFLKLLFFLLVGVYVTYFVFDGFADITAQASKLPDFAAKNQFGSLEAGINWFLLCILSMFAIFLLPRQFHTAIVENNREQHLKTAIWLFPLYLLLFNLFVYPIAWGGKVLFADANVDTDFYSLLIPQQMGHTTLTVLVFLGGFSAAISMIVVSSISLATMLGNNLLIPYGFLGKFTSTNSEINTNKIVKIRKFSIFSLIILAYLVYRYFVLDYSLVSIGLIAFVVIAQLAPAFFGALYWKRGSHRGAIYGILVGFAICFYTLLLPYAMGIYGAEVQNPIGIAWLHPMQLFGLNYLQPIPHALFWSMLGNVFTYGIVSVSFKGDYRERNYAEMFVDIDKHITHHENAYVWKGTAYKSDIEKVLLRFLGEERTKRALKLFHLKYQVPEQAEMADARFIKFAENLLTGPIGTASAKILISSVVKEEQISLKEVLYILEESKENIILNKKLRETSEELQQLSEQLKKANAELLEKDAQKDEFLNTVTHELRTPITAIRATSEILKEDEEVPDYLRKQFLENIISESDRLNRLIDKILDLEKWQTKKQQLHLTENNWQKTLQKAWEPLQQLLEKNHITWEMQLPKELKVQLYDEERMIQVINNLISNAIKFASANNGQIRLTLTQNDFATTLQLYNNGAPIPKADIDQIFDKFYQSSDQNFKKPIGSGLGLAISKKIVEEHQGTLHAENLKVGVQFTAIIPF